MRYGLLAVLLLALAAAGCAQPPAQRPAPLRELVITGSEFRFDPATLDLQVGQPVRLTFRNTGSTAHDLQIVDMPATVEVKKQEHTEHGKTGANGAVHLGTEASGQQASIEFTPKQAGEFQMICTLPGHSEAGMRGVIRVR